MRELRGVGQQREQEGEPEHRGQRREPAARLLLGPQPGGPQGPGDDQDEADEFHQPQRTQHGPQPGGSQFQAVRVRGSDAERYRPDHFAASRLTSSFPWWWAQPSRKTPPTSRPPRATDIQVKGRTNDGSRGTASAPSPAAATVRVAILISPSRAGPTHGAEPKRVGAMLFGADGSRAPHPSPAAPYGRLPGKGAPWTSAEREGT